MTEFHQAQIRADWQDWTFGAHQATTRAAAAEELIALRRQYTELTEPDLLRLADSWRSDDTSGPYFTFTAAHADTHANADHDHDYRNGHDHDDGTEPTLIILDATFVKALLQELADQTPAALAALLDSWTEQRSHAAYAGLRPTPVQPPRVALLLPRDDSQWPPDSWNALLALPLDDPRFDRTLLRWDSNSRLWSPAIRPT